MNIKQALPNDVWVWTSQENEVWLVLSKNFESLKLLCLDIITAEGAIKPGSIWIMPLTGPDIFLRGWEKI